MPQRVDFSPQVEKLAEGFSPLEKFEGFSPEGFSPQSDTCEGFSPGSRSSTAQLPKFVAYASSSPTFLDNI